MCANSKYVYTGSADATMGHYQLEGQSLAPASKEFVKKDSSIKQMLATEEFVYVLYNN